MRALDRKLLRDLGRMRTQAVAIALVVASGMALFVALLATYGSLQLSKDRYYEAQRFADVWVRLAQAPQSILRDIAALPGVAAVAGSLTSDAILDVPGTAEPVTAVIHSIPARAGHASSDVYIRRGRHVEAGRPGEVLVSEAFAEKNHLALGDSVLATIAGQRIALRIVGVALSPEQVMVTPPGALAPDDRRFGVFWMEEGELGQLLRMPNAVNEVTIRLAAPESEGAVIVSVDKLLEPYGGLGAYGRGNQPSNVDLEAHIVAIRGLTVMLPVIFLIVAAFLVNLVFSRLVSIQRQQVGMLKAYGYSNARVTAHFAELVVLIVVAGIVAGIPVGVWLGRVMTTYLVSFFRFPALVFRVDPIFVVAAATVAILGSLSGALRALRGVAMLPPAVAMSPAAPIYRPPKIARTRLIAWLAPGTRMIVRNVTRWPVRAMLTMAGMSLAVALLILGETMADGIARITDVQFRRSQREDVSVMLTLPQSLEHWRDFEGLPGVRRAEPYRVVPARIRIRGTAQDVALVGLPGNGVMRHIVAANFEETPIPPDGAILGSWVAARLGIRRGDVIPIELRERRRQTIPVQIVGLVDQPSGASMFMDLGALGRLIDEPETFSGVNLLVDSEHEGDLYGELKRAPRVKSVSLRLGSLASAQSAYDTTINFVREIIAVFAAIIAFGMVYNVARIALAERGYELATLRVLGFTRREISGVLLGEIGTLALLAVPIGFVVGTWLSATVAASVQSERMRLPASMPASSYAWAFLVFTVAVFASALLVRRQLDRLDLVEVLKARE